MRVGIVTFHCAYNFGSALQTVALKRVLESMSYEARVVDYRSRDFCQYELVRRPVTVKSAGADVLFYIRNRRRRDAFESFMGDHMNLTRRFTYEDEGALEALRDDFDCFVCGSDQIWNLDCTQGPVGPYFLSFAGNRRRVAYAPSLAHTAFKPEYFGDVERAQVGSWLARFDALSVRESSTLPVYQALTDKPIDVCLDPTLLLRGEDYRPLMAPECSLGDLSGDLFAYMLEPNPALVSYAGALARREGLSVTYVNKRGIDFGVPSRNLYGMGPDGFLRAIVGSRFVVTNSFHATVFSVLLGRPFQTFVTSKSGSRMAELLESLGLSDRLIDGSSVSMPNTPDTVLIESRLAPMREHSLSFLTRALEE